MGKIKKREGEKLKMENGRSYTNEERTFFFFFFFFSFVLGLPKWKFSIGKKHFTLGKSQEK